MWLICFETSWMGYIKRIKLAYVLEYRLYVGQFEIAEIYTLDHPLVQPSQGWAWFLAATNFSMWRSISTTWLLGGNALVKSKMLVWLYHFCHCFDTCLNSLWSMIVSSWFYELCNKRLCASSWYRGCGYAPHFRRRKKISAFRPAVTLKIISHGLNAREDAAMLAMLWNYLSQSDRWHWTQQPCSYHRLQEVPFASCFSFVSSSPLIPSVWQDLFSPSSISPTEHSWNLSAPSFHHSSCT